MGTRKLIFILSPSYYQASHQPHQQRLLQQSIRRHSPTEQAQTKNASQRITVPQLPTPIYTARARKASSTSCHVTLTVLYNSSPLSSTLSQALLAKLRVSYKSREYGSTSSTNAYVIDLANPHLFIPTNVIHHPTQRHSLILHLHLAPDSILHPSKSIDHRSEPKFGYPSMGPFIQVAAHAGQPYSRARRSSRPTTERVRYSGDSRSTRRSRPR